MPGFLPFDSGLLLIFTYIVIFVMIILAALAAFYTIQWSRILIGRKWWAFILSGTSCYLVTIVVTISSISLRSFLSLLGLFGAFIWSVGGLLLAIGMIGIYKDSVRRGG